MPKRMIKKKEEKKKREKYNPSTNVLPFPFAKTCFFFNPTEGFCRLILNRCSIALVLECLRLDFEFLYPETFYVR